MARILVTGGAGFIGTNLVRHLLDAGDEVVVVDRLPTRRQRANADLLAGEGAEVVVADLAAVDLVSLLRRADGGTPDGIVHLAGQPGVQTSWSTGFAAHLDGNVGLAQRVLEAALEVGVPRVVMASSSSVYGDRGGWVAEDGPLAPVSPYGATKAAMELLAGTYAARGLSVVSLRYFTAYGRLQRPDMAIHRMLRAGLGGPPFPVRGAGRQVRDFTHVDDVVAATAAALRAPLDPGTTINVGSGRPVSLDELLAACEVALGHPVPTCRVPATPGDPARTAARIDRAAQLLGWAPRVPLADGLADQLRWQAGRALPVPLAS
ncbi:NAD-dependent epimerase/dehydratase family protein [Euzebya sp.]|uniref:NAD-dependent epimerase/dehydratase family protein n=1 Tax=Euzebya sp. TaxID=1971409 RepID=UPI0035188B32